MTVLAFKEICKVLLEHDVPYIISERFSQDNVENYFGRQRALVEDLAIQRDSIVVIYNTNILEYSVRLIDGNVQWPASKFNAIITEPLTKKKQ